MKTRRQKWPNEAIFDAFSIHGIIHFFIVTLSQETKIEGVLEERFFGASPKKDGLNSETGALPPKIGL
jgi:hypothetical protein